MKPASLAALAVALLSMPALADDYMIALGPPDSAWSSAGFFINRVIDGRADTSDIGFTLTGMFNKMKPVQFAEGLRPALLKYLGALLPADSAAQPVAVKVLELLVSEKSGFSGEYAKCQVKLSFYRDAGDSLEYLFTAGDYRKRSGMDVTGYHEGHIRMGLEKCLADFAAWRGNAAAGTDSAALGRLPLDTLSGKVPINPEFETRSAILGLGYVGANSSCWGMAYSRHADRKKWCPVWCLGLLFRSIDYEKGNERYSGDLMEAFQTFGAIRKLSGGRVGLKLEGSIPFGWERIQQQDGAVSDPKFFVGLALSQMFTTLPARRGFFLAFGATERAQVNSEAYPWDIGAVAQLGIQW